MEKITVIKRDGSKQPLDLNRFHRVVEFACEGITGVSVSEVELATQLQFRNNIKSSEIQETLIKAAAGLISAEAPNYQYVAGRLINYHLRKEIFGQFEPIHLYDHVVKMVKKGFYDKLLLREYSKTEWDRLNNIIKHKRDENLTYAAMEQFRGKYLVQNRVSGQILETPQIAYLLIAATLFHKYDPVERLKWVKDYYDAISTHKISIPTPVLAGVRTPKRQFSSCVLIETGDSLDSIGATGCTVMDHVSERAGLGLHAVLRAEGAGVSGNTKTHTGIRPFWRVLQSNVQSCSQGGIRPGAATMNWPFFHFEFENLIVLKNNKGTEENRLRQMDYCIHLTKMFYQRVINDEDITLFCPADVPDLFEAFYSDTKLFEELYVKYEQNTRIRKQKIRAYEMMQMITTERFETGRIYIMNVDHVNQRGSFNSKKAAIKTTNLCTEITLPTKPVMRNGDGEIAMCILSALNMGEVTTREDIEKYSRLAVYALNELINMQDYLAEQSRRSTLKRRPIGIGAINLAYWMAKRKSKYSEPDLEALDEWMEMFSYYMISASIELAEKHGPCEGYEDTRYSEGIFPHELAKPEARALVNRKPTMPWNLLRLRLQKYGMYNSTYGAMMPGESSAIVANGTSGIDPITDLVTYKQSKDGIFAQVVPEIHNLKHQYESRWDMPHTRGMIEIGAIIQCWIDQAISLNTSYNPMNYPDQKVPEEELIRDILYAYKLGLKTLYYNNTNDMAGEVEEADCEACKL